MVAVREADALPGLSTPTEGEASPNRDLARPTVKLIPSST
jgi:hypothetical protein